MEGRTLSHYAVLERLGAGGMGLVYRARDLRLGREVAIKLLPGGALSSADARARFHREALALSRVNHPSIAIIYEFDREGPLDFLVMERVEGETLEERLARGPLDEREIAALGLQIAAALVAAHEQGVVHRDLKPGNIMVTPRGLVKVLDFGVAKLLGPPAPGVSAHTSGGPALVGTLAYMAPEQLRESEVDARTDLYAFGVLIFRMATGRLPFEEQAAAVQASRILNDAPPSPRALRPGLSAALEAIVLRLLEKEPARRYGSAAALAADLKRLGSVAAGAARARFESLVVLPLEDLSRDPGEEFFADGMTDTLIANLAQISALRVISRTSAMRYKGVRQPLPEIARALGVEAVVEGTVLRSGGRVRITAQLVEAATDGTLWSRSYEREICDVLALQSEVAQAIVEEIRVQLTPREQARLAQPRAVDPRVLEHYLRGRFFWNQRSPQGLERSVGLFRSALDADPDYAAAWSGLADAWSIMGAFRIERPAEAFPRAKDAAARALALDPDLAEAHTSLAFAQSNFDWDAAVAEPSFRRAISLNPGYATARQWFADFLSVHSRFDEALEQVRLARTLDPLSPAVAGVEPSVLYYARRFEEAVASLRELVVLHPEHVPMWLDLGRALEELGRLEEARAAFETGVRVAGIDPDESPALGHLHAVAGNRAKARAVIERLSAASARRYQSAYSIANIHVALGGNDLAFEYLDRALEDRDPMMIYLHVHPRLDALRGDPRFAQLERKVGPAR